MDSTNKDLNNRVDIICFVLDESGSMGKYYRQTIDGFNEYMSEVRSDDSESLLRLVSFNSHKLNVAYDFENIAAVSELGPGQYRTRGRTPLLDAVGESICETDEFLSNHEKEVNQVFFTIMTDGYENASVEYDIGTIRKMISERQDKDWIFNFLGGDQNVEKTGGRLGISKGNRYAYDARNPKEAFMAGSKGILRAKRLNRRGVDLKGFFTGANTR